MQETLKPKNEPNAFDFSVTKIVQLSLQIHATTYTHTRTAATHTHSHTFSAMQEQKLKAYKAAKANGKSWDCLPASQQELRAPAGDISSSC